MRHDFPFRSARRQSLLPLALGFAALLIFGAEAARGEASGQAPGGTTSSFSDAACSVCEAQYEQCGPQLHLGLCIGRYVQCLKENYCEADARAGSFTPSTSTAPQPLQSPLD